MDAKPRSLKDIFDAQCRYMVPLFQRSYVWTEEDQWEPLWEDISALADRYFRADPFRPHFMGAVVLEQLNTATGTLDLRQIIDGQQRLTTLQIVIEAASDVCESLGQIAAIHARELRRLTRNDQREENPDVIFKVWPTNVDRDQFRLVMSVSSADEVQNQYADQLNISGGHSIAKAYLFFHKKITEWLSTPDNDILKKKLDALQNAIYRGLIVVVIDLDDKDDAQMIFETLNARGTPLLASDLVKNFILQYADGQGNKLDNLYYRYWEFFDITPFWRIKVQAGRRELPQIELFLQHYITILTRDEVLVTNLFNTFRQHVKKHPEIDSATYMADLNRYGQIYKQFFEYPVDTREGLFFRRIQDMEITTIYPLLLIIFEKLGKPEYDKQRRAILTDLESFLVRRMICELGTKNYNNLFLEAVKKFADCDPNQLGSYLRSFLLEQTIDISKWPKDEEFERSWELIPAYQRFRSQKRLRMILEALELQRRANARTEDLNLPKKKLSIEHIMPRGWTEKNWPLPIDSEEAMLERSLLLHTFGNLTLVTGSLNSTLSNDPWAKKKGTLKQYSILLLNADLQNENEWNEDSIKNRSKALFKLARNIWPHP